MAKTFVDHGPDFLIGNALGKTFSNMSAKGRKGIQVAGTDFRLAPSLVDSPRVRGDPKQLVPILLHGLTGPLDGKTYQAGFMAPAKALGLTRERDLARVLSYVRYAWDNKGGPVTEAEVKTIQKKHAKRTAPWTEAELKQLP